MKETGLRTPMVVDVGAGLGYFSLVAAALRARVIAFEPNSRNARKFSKSIVKNGFGEYVSLFQNSVGNEGSFSPVSLNGQATGFEQGVYGVDYANPVSLSFIVRENVDVLRIYTGGME
jgi:FkbM family methyltransferase